MSSTFFGLTIAASGLNTSQAQINTTANNISNVNTNGYSKQVVNTVAASALRVYQSYGTTGTGVEAKSVTQCRDLYYDEKYWNNESALGFYNKKDYYMKQIENYYSETTSNTGFSTIYAKMFNAMSTLQGSPGDDTVRKQFISNAKQFTEYFNQLATKLEDLQNSINDEIKTAVDDINSISEKIAILTKQINVIEQGGGHANELRDQRSLLVDELSEIVDVQVKEVDVKNTRYPDMHTGATYFQVYINGQILVDTYDYNTLNVISRNPEEKCNQSDIGGLYEIVWTKDGDRFNSTPSSMGGSLKAMFEMRDGNNNENLHANVLDATADTITVYNIDTLDENGLNVNELNLPDKGQINTNNKRYTYNSFSYNTNKYGKIESVTFYLNEGLTLEDQGNLIDKKLEVGEAVDFMGIPYYQNQMNLFLRNFCKAFNDIEIGSEDDTSSDRGVDMNKRPVDAFFISRDTLDSQIEHQMRNALTTTVEEAGTQVKKGVTIYSAKDDNDPTKNYESYYLLTAKNIGILKDTDKDATRFATTTLGNYYSGVDAADIVVDLQKLQRNVTLFRGGSGEAFLQCVYSDVTVDAQECKIFTKNFENIQRSISEQRMSISGVDEDEEALDLIKFQNAYNLASKCISVFSEIYDRLILNTGV